MIVLIVCGTKNILAHFNLDQVLELVKELLPKKTILTNMHSDLDYDQAQKKITKIIFFLGMME